MPPSDERLRYHGGTAVIVLAPIIEIAILG